MADSTRSMRKSILDRDILAAFKNRLLTEITSDDLRDLCTKGNGARRPRRSTCETSSSKSTGLPSCTARRWPTRPTTWGPSSIATFVPKDRALSPVEIRLMHRQLETVASYPTIRLALRLILLTLVRKEELVHATWNEIDFENALWTIPKERMKGSKAHNVYLS